MADKAEKVSTPWAHPDNDGMAGPPIETASREELARSGYNLAEHHFETEEQTQARLAKAAKGAPSNKSLTPNAETKTATTADADLEGVEFASAAARAAATDAGLSAADFKRQKPSSDAGHTKADVERIAAKSE